MQKRICSFVVLMLLVICAACSQVADDPAAVPDVLVATGIGRAEAAPNVHTPGGPLARSVYFDRLRKNLPDWADYSIEAVATAPVPDDAASPALALVIGRQNARDLAMQDLMADLRDFAGRDEDTVGDIIDSDPALRWRVHQALRRGTRFASNPAEATETITVTAVLPLESVALAIWGPDPGTPVRISLPRKTAWWWPFGGRVRAPEEPMQRIAFENAAIDARQMLLEKVRAIPLFENHSIGARMARDPKTARKVYETLDTMRVLEVETPRPDVCRMRVEMRVSELVDSLRD